MWLYYRNGGVHKAGVAGAPLAVERGRGKAQAVFGSMGRLEASESGAGDSRAVVHQNRYGLNVPIWVVLTDWYITVTSS